MMKDSNELVLLARCPTHPGAMLREEFMPDYGLSVSQLASKLGVSRQSVNELLRERRSLSVDMALRLARLFGTTAQYWVNMQRNVDVWEAFEQNRSTLDLISPISVPEYNEAVAN